VEGLPRARGPEHRDVAEERTAQVAEEDVALIAGTWHPVPYVDEKAAELLDSCGKATASRAEDDTPPPAEGRRLRRQWARLIRRIYEADPLLCECGNQMRVISFLTDPPVVEKILRHLEQRSSAESERSPPGIPTQRAS